MKKLYLIAGPNGAGKTTASYSILPEILNCNEFVNADEIAKGISPFNPESVSIQAGKLMLIRIQELLNKGKTFAFETTLVSKYYVELVKEAKKEKYEVILLFLMLNSVNLAIERVKIRVKEGGHNIPEDVIRGRYYNGLRNFFKMYFKVVDKWFMVDNSGEVFHFIAEGNDELLIIKDIKVWSELKAKYDERR